MGEACSTTSGETYRRYDVTAPSYEELYRSEQYCKYRGVFEALGSPAGEILDIGCGTGFLADYLAEHGLWRRVSRYICLEPSGSMIGIAVGKHGSRPVFAAIQAMAEEMPLTDNSVDEAYMFTVWNNLCNPLKALAEALRVARRRVVVTVLAKASTPPPPGLRFIGTMCGDHVYVLER